MNKILKIMPFFCLIYLATSISFVSSIVFAQDLSNCPAVRKWEQENWPAVFYCKYPLIKGSDYRYFVFVNKPNDDIDVILSKPNPNPGDFTIESIEPLHQTEDGKDVASWDRSKITVNGNGTFIVRGSGQFLTLKASDDRVRLQSFERCEELIRIVYILNEEARFEIVRYLNSEEDFLKVFGSAIQTLRSAIQPYPITISAEKMALIQWDFPELLEKFGSGYAIDIVQTVGGSKPGSIFSTRNFAETQDFIGYAKKYGLSYSEPFTVNQNGDVVYKVTISNEPSVQVRIKNIWIEFWKKFDLAKQHYIQNQFNEFDEYIKQIAALDEQLGNDFGYPDSCVKDYVTQKINSGYDLKYQTRDSSGVFFDGWKSGKKIDWRLLYADIKFFDVDNVEAIKWGQSRASIHYTLSRESAENRIKGYVNQIINWAGRELESGKMTIDEFNGFTKSIEEVEIEAIRNLDFLTQKMAPIQISSITYNFLSRAFETHTDIIHFIFDESPSLTYTESLNIMELRLIPEAASLMTEIDISQLDGTSRQILRAFTQRQIDMAEMVVEHKFKLENLDVVRYIRETDATNRRVAVEMSLESAVDLEIHGRDLQSKGFEPTQQAKDDFQSACSKSLQSAEEVGKTVQTDFDEKVGESLQKEGLEIQEKRIYSFNEAMKRIFSIRNIGSGFLFSFFSSISGKAAEIWSLNPDNAVLGRLLGNSLQLGGQAALIYWILQTGYAGIQVAITSGIIALGSFILATVIGFAIGVVIGFIAAMIVNWISCIMYPDLPSCHGCEIDPGYGRLKFGVDENILSKYDYLNFAVYGLRYCNPGDTKIEVYVNSRPLSKPEFRYYEGFYKEDVECHSIDGRCFDCQIPIDWIKDGRWYIGYVFRPGGGIKYSSDIDDYREFTVCPDGYSVDLTNSECVSCDTSNKEISVLDGIANNLCEDADNELGNYVVNPSFEEEMYDEFSIKIINGWTIHSGKGSISRDNYYSGYKSLKSYSGGTVAAETNLIPVRPDIEYELTGWYSFGELPNCGCNNAGQCKSSPCKGCVNCGEDRFCIESESKTNWDYYYCCNEADCNTHECTGPWRNDLYACEYDFSTCVDHFCVYDSWEYCGDEKGECINWCADTGCETTINCECKEIYDYDEECCTPEGCSGCKICDYDYFHAVCYHGETTNWITYSWIEEPKLHYGKFVPCCESEDCPDYYCYTINYDKWWCRARIDARYECINRDQLCSPADSPISSARNVCYYLEPDYPEDYYNSEECLRECKEWFESKCGRSQII